MGIFDVFAGGGRKKENERKSLRACAGMRFEVFSQDNRLLFIGNLLMRGSRIELQQIEGPSLKGERFAGAPFLPVTLRGFDAKEKMAVYIAAVISRLSERTWEVEEASVTGMENERTFFRQNTFFRGTAVQIGKESARPRRCEVRNVSAGGVCIRTQELFRLGERLMVRFDILPGKSFAHRCVVRRVSERKTSYEYGCQFTGLDQNTEDQIARMVTELQIQQRKREMGQ